MARHDPILLPRAARAKGIIDGNYQQMTSAPVLPNYLGLPFRILVSPFVHFDPETRTTDIMMFNSRNLGALIVDEDPHVKSWEDGQYNLVSSSCLTPTPSRAGEGRGSAPPTRSIRGQAEECRGWGFREWETGVGS